MPGGVFDTRLGHIVTAHRSHHGNEFARAVNSFAKHERGQKVAQHDPGTIRAFGAVEGTFAGRNLAPPVAAVGDEFHQE